MNRRQYISLAATVPLLAACGSAGEPERHARRIKLTGIEIFAVKVNRRGNWVIARLNTDAGLSGYGDASHSGNGDPSIPKLREYFGWIENRGIFDVEWLRLEVEKEYATHHRAASCAVSAIEQALYDIQAQALGVPLYQLFGGKLRDTVRNYANINRSTDERSVAGFTKMAESALEAGFDAIKMACFDGMPRDGSAAEIEAHTQLGVDIIYAVRELMGRDRDLLIDAHSNFDLERSLDLVRRVEDAGLFWLEEVSRDWEVLAKINEVAPMPTAGGESLYGLEENLRYITSKTVDTLMPDVKYCGGMLNLKKISAMAEAAGLPVAPHGPASPFGNMAAAHVCVGMPNFQILEFSHGEVPWRAELCDPPEPMEDGYLTVPGRPGLGLRINEQVAARYKA